jgi:hypothetical protein
MRLIKLTLILAIGLISAPAFGGGLSKEEALLEFSFECAQCAAYFGLTSKCFVSSFKETTKQVSRRPAISSISCSTRPAKRQACPTRP